MKAEIIVSSDKPVCLVGGAKIENSSFSADFPFVNSFVAVDGGADHLLRSGITPAAVIGDLDSISDQARATFADQLCHISEQETTDFEKALIRVAAPAVLAVGFTGGRIDHSLAVLNVMARYPERAVLLADPDDVSFIARSDGTDLTLPAGCRISLMPLADLSVTATGLEWPLHDMALAPAGKTSASNAAVGGPIHVQTGGPLLITLPRAHLPEALQAVFRAG
ncbi:thiamine diphosphokinase [Yoonia sp. BS5-3]|uniref:Thiamine diphosphokinase n=1 Tax=Yoonia phaeophyticola TaxID=3137369 RepID=A0ABZ2V4M2_9RHOB